MWQTTIALAVVWMGIATAINHGTVLIAVRLVSAIYGIALYRFADRVVWRGSQMKLISQAATGLGLGA